MIWCSLTLHEPKLFGLDFRWVRKGRKGSKGKKKQIIMATATKNKARHLTGNEDVERRQGDACSEVSQKWTCRWIFKFASL